MKDEVFHRTRGFPDEDGLADGADGELPLDDTDEDWLDDELLLLLPDSVGATASGCQ